MRQYELAIRIAQIHHLIDERKYKKALAVVQTLDMKQIKSLSDLNAIAEVYTRTAQYDNAKDIYIKIYNKSHTRRCLYRLICLEIRTGDIDEAKSYYQEFLKMNANARDAIVLKYRIEKASGVPIGRLIDTLKELKVYEYIEEWAYELAKLYYKAGRFEECKVECQDIILWFGHGEIVERSKKLIEYVDDKETMAYLDDKDFTIMDSERPNPDDTGSLPTLKEYLEPRPRHHEVLAYNEDNAEEKRVKTDDKKNKIKDSDDFIDDYEEDDFEVDADIGRIAKEGLQKLSGLLKKGGKKENAEKPEPSIREKEYIPKLEIEDPASYSEVPDEKLLKKELAGENLSDKDILKETSQTNGIKFNLQSEEAVTRTAQVEKPKTEFDDTRIVNTDNSKDSNLKSDIKVKIPVIINKPVEYEKPVYSQSGTGITQDLSREISAIYEAEQKEQLKEKSVMVVPRKKKAPKDSGDVSNIISRMTNAVKKDESKNITPANIEDIEDMPKTLPRMGVINQIEQVVPQVQEKSVQITQEAVDVKPEHKVQEDMKQELAEEIVQKEAEEKEPAEETVEEELKTEKKEPAEETVTVNEKLKEEEKSSVEDTVTIQEELKAGEKKLAEEIVQKELKEEEKNSVEEIIIVNEELKEEGKKPIEDTVTIQEEPKVDEKKLAEEIVQERLKEEERSSVEETVIVNEELKREGKKSIEETLQKKPKVDEKKLAEDTIQKEPKADEKKLVEDTIQEELEKDEKKTIGETIQEELKGKEQTEESVQKIKKEEEHSQIEEAVENLLKEKEQKRTEETVQKVSQEKRSLEETAQEVSQELIRGVIQNAPQVEEQTQSDEIIQKALQNGEQDISEDSDILESLLEADLAEIAARKAQEEALAKAKEAQAKAEEARRKRIEAERKRKEAQKKQLEQREEELSAVTQEDEPYTDKTGEEFIMRKNGHTELNEKELPTTRALHRSFDDVLTLIGGELEPSHFVFVGNSSELIVGLSKRIVKLMKEKGYLSIGRIAKINAKQLNSMDINEFKNQLKGNCLLIDEAAELMVPTIASVFLIMEEFYGDFVVILSDEGKTLDQLFRFAPALARRFKYIIDISAYTENDIQR